MEIAVICANGRTSSPEEPSRQQTPEKYMPFL